MREVNMREVPMRKHLGSFETSFATVSVWIFRSGDNPRYFQLAFVSSAAIERVFRLDPTRSLESILVEFPASFGFYSVSEIALNTILPRSFEGKIVVESEQLEDSWIRLRARSLVGPEPHGKCSITIKPFGKSVMVTVESIRDNGDLNWIYNI